MTESLTLRIRRLNPEKDRDLPIPEYMSPGASGLDLPAAIEGEIILAPGEIRLVPTGLALAIPPGYEGQVRPRSGLASETRHHSGQYPGHHRLRLPGRTRISDY